MEMLTYENGSLAAANDPCVLSGRIGFCGWVVTVTKSCNPWNWHRFCGLLPAYRPK